jgi:hypothetical protein
VNAKPDDNQNEQINRTPRRYHRNPRPKQQQDSINTDNIQTAPNATDGTSVPQNENSSRNSQSNNNNNARRYNNQDRIFRPQQTTQQLGSQQPLEQHNQLEQQNPPASVDGKISGNYGGRPVHMRGGGGGGGMRQGSGYGGYGGRGRGGRGRGGRGGGAYTYYNRSYKNDIKQPNNTNNTDQNAVWIYFLILYKIIIKKYLISAD